MSTEYRCDRCHTLADGRGMKVTTGIIEGGVISGRVDLCHECKVKFFNFMDGKPVEGKCNKGETAWIR